MKSFFLGATLALVASTAFAQTPAANPKAIWAGGKGGAYLDSFCPPLPDALSKNYFQGYKCSESRGTPDNVEKVLATPTNIGFGQLDVYMRLAQDRAEDFKKLHVIRTDLACEGLWMITKNDQIENYGSVMGFARRIPFIIPGKASGANVTFENLKTLDPDNMGKASNISYTESDANGSAVSKMIDQIAAGNGGEVGFFVQFADPQNANIKRVLEKKLKLVPVASRELFRAKSVNDETLYRLEEFQLSGGWSGKEMQTACTPVAIFTGTPDAVAAANPNNKNAVEDQKELIDRVAAVKREDMLPKDSRMASLLRSARRIADKGWEDAMAATDNARKAAETYMNKQ